MSKPTLVQTLLKQPSQSYRSQDVAPKKDYYSTKQDMIRIAAEAARVPPQNNSAPPSRSSSTRSSSNAATSRAPVAERRRPPPRRPPIDDSDDDSDDSDSDLDVFFTPNTSPRTSMASSSATIRRPSRRSLHADTHLPLQLPPDIPTPSPSSPTAPVAVPSTRTPSTSSASQTRAMHALSSSSSLSSTSLEAHSLFSDYIGSGESNTDQSLTGHKKPESNTQIRTDARWKTRAEEEVRWLVPPTGSTKSTEKHTSAAKPKATVSVTKATTTPDLSTTSSTAKKNVTSKTPTYAHLGVGHAANGHSNPATQTKLDDQKSKSAASVNSNGTTLSSANSSPVKTSSSPRQPHTFSAFASIPASTPTTTSTPAQGSSVTSTSSRPTTKDTTSPSPRADRSSAPTSPPKSDSRMAIPASTSTAAKPAQTQAKHQRSQSTPNASTTTSTKSTSSSNSAKSSSAEPIAVPSTKTATLRKKPPPVKPGSMLMPIGGMDAVLEEDEDGPLTPRMESRPLSDELSTPDGWDWSAATHSSQSTSSPSSQGRSLRHTSNTRRAQSSRAHSVDRDSSSSTSSASTSRGTHSRAPPKTLTAEVQALVSSFPVAGELPSKGTQGYSALVLPRAPAANAPPNGRLHKPRPPGMITSGRIDLTLDGVAQTTMASVEVVRGLGARNAAGVLGKLGFGRKRTVSSGTATTRGPAPLPLPTPAGNTNARPEGNGDNTVGHNGAPSVPAPTTNPLSTPLAFTSYRSPPDHIPSESVLVQIWAVGLDGIDARLVGCGFERASFRHDNGDYTTRPSASGTEQETDTEEWDEEHRNGAGEESTGMEDTEDEQGDVPSTASTSRKGPLAALGRSISLRLTRGGSGKSKHSSSPPKQRDPQRASTLPVATPPRPGNAKATTAPGSSPRPPISTPKRSFSLKRNNTASSYSPVPATATSPSPNKPPKDKKTGVHVAEVGYIPGRSFVGRVLECGWDVSEEVVRKGEWVMGLLDVRKAGALTEFVIVDRHRIHRVPYPRMDDAQPQSMSSLTLDELALLPLCGLLAYRAVRTFIFSFSSSHDGRPPPEAANYSAPANTGTNHSRPLLEHEKGYKRRALVLRGHDGIGAMAVQMLVQHGWRVSVHVPFSSVPAHTPQEVSERFMHVVEQRAREWGADEVIFDDGEEGGMDEGRGAAVRVLESLREDGDVFDAVLDTVGGKIVWAAAERLLKFQGSSTTDDTKPSIRRRGVGQFTTLVGHTPERVIPTARDNFRAGLRALRMGSANGNASAGAVDGGAGSDTKGHGKVGYAWVSVAQDVDWEGDDVSETLGSVLRLALDKGVRPLTDSLGVDGMRKTRVVPFEQAPYLFVDNGPLTDGGTVVVAVA